MWERVSASFCSRNGKEVVRGENGWVRGYRCEPLLWFIFFVFLRTSALSPGTSYPLLAYTEHPGALDEESGALCGSLSPRARMSYRSDAAAFPLLARASFLILSLCLLTPLSPSLLLFKLRCHRAGAPIRGNEFNGRKSAPYENNVFVACASFCAHIPRLSLPLVR